MKLRVDLQGGYQCAWWKTGPSQKNHFVYMMVLHLLDHNSSSPPLAFFCLASLCLNNIIISSMAATFERSMVGSLGKQSCHIKPTHTRSTDQLVKRQHSAILRSKNDRQGRLSATATTMQRPRSCRNYNFWRKHSSLRLTRDKTFS